MSDQDVVTALDAMEVMLQEGRFPVSEMAAWQARYDAAKASAERGPGWEAIAERSRLMAKRLDLALAGVLADRDRVQRELRLLAKGGRALKGYKTSAS